MIAKQLLEHCTHLNLFIGKAINPAHQNPDLPISIVIKMGLIDELAEILRKWASRSPFPTIDPSGAGLRLSGGV